jgi:calcineurin-like phosphoesterase family protein
MTRYFTSDLHFSHRNVITYCNRPYKDFVDMNNAMVQTWNDKVKPDDIVYVIGDFSLNPSQAALYTPMLNGIKHLISGNHDACFAKKERNIVHQKNIEQRYLNMGWASVSQSSNLVLLDNTEVLLSHLPYAPNVGENLDIRYLDYRPKDLGSILLCGHLHCRFVKNKNTIDVGFDNKLDLYSEGEIVTIIRDAREFIPSRLTEWYKEREKNETASNSEY